MTGLVAEGVRAGYDGGADIVRECDVRVGAGELVVVIGPNGAGKSTLVKALVGLVQVRAGRIDLEGRPLAGLPTHAIVRRGVGYVPQTRNVFARLTVEENLVLGAYVEASEAAARRERVYEWFPLLAQRRRQRAGTLSGGQRQVVAMARALMGEPRLLLLDEPSAGLAPQSQRDVFARIREINDRGVAVLMVEQNARQALAIADRGYVLERGRNRMEGPGKQLLGDPRVAELYLGGTTE